jgi:phosphoenolpyruvate carboxykinase (GTP)
MGEYLTHWLRMQQKIEYPPKIFQVNWFRKNKDGKFLWPGYGENLRVLKWVVDRARVKVGGQETMLGWVPKAGDLDLSDLDVTSEAVDEATSINVEEWKEELVSQGEWFQRLGPTAPKVLELQREFLLARLNTR